MQRQLRMQQALSSHLSQQLTAAVAYVYRRLSGIELEPSASQIHHQAGQSADRAAYMVKVMRFSQEPAQTYSIASNLF